MYVFLDLFVKVMAICRQNLAATTRSSVPKQFNILLIAIRNPLREVAYNLSMNEGLSKSGLSHASKSPRKIRSEIITDSMSGSESFSSL